MRLSDSLHGAADKAPVDGMQVSAVEAARRVQRRRSLRAGGTGLLATAGVALLAVGVVAPNLGGSSGSDGADMAAGLPESAMDDAGGTMLASGFCGGTVDGLAYGDSPVTLDVALLGGDAGGTTYEPAETLPWETTTTAREDVSLGAGRPLTYAYVLWDGMVVGRYPGPDDVFTDDLFMLDLESGESYTDESGVVLVNCWDGAPLPAGDYELVLAQEFWSTEPIAEPTLPTDPDATAAPEQTFVPEPDFTEESVDPVEPTVEPVDPDSAVSNDNDAATSGMTDGDLGTATDGAAGSGLAADQGFRTVAEPLAFTISGDPVDEPFASYLGGTDPGVVETPDDMLTPDTARSLYEDGLRGAWDMAPGTQRVVLTSDSTDTTGELWDRRYFGCSWDGSSGLSFPAESAEIDLLDVSLPLPSRLPVSYGWVVDGNPEIDARVTNVSDWTLPLWDGGQPSLVLVQDGRVVATAYPANAYGDGSYMIMEDMVGSDEPGLSSLIAPGPGGDGLMSPGESYEGTYLWREVSTCDPVGSLDAGTYTVLDQRTVYVDSGAQYYSYDMSAEEDVAVEGFDSDGDSSEATSGAADAMPVPAPDDDYDWIELTVWTSLATVTVTT